MKGVILAGGMGTRLRPVTLEIPKPLLTVRKKPIVNHLIELLGRYGISEIAVLVAREHESDFERWKKHWSYELPGVKISIFFEEKPRGTFGGMEIVRDWLGGDNFILTNGDELKDFNLKELIDFHRRNMPAATIALVRVPNPSEYGVPVLDRNWIREFLEKPEHPPSHFINSGLYVLEQEVFDYADFSREYLMIEKDIFPRLASAGKLMGLEMEGGRWYDCGNLERWEKAIREW